jgi:uncharacterized membrane protein YfcA
MASWLITVQLQIIFVTANLTFLQSVTTQPVDVVLAILLLAGAVIGAQYGTRMGSALKGEQLRALMAIMILAVCSRVAYEMIATPLDSFSIEKLL